MNGEMKELLDEIVDMVNHGECFRNTESYENLRITIDLFKGACNDVFEENQE